MPTYEYQCLKCKKKFEKLQKMTDAPLKKCPHCSGKAQRLISTGTGFIFKGSGFYINDYKKPAKEKKTEPKKNEPAASPPTGGGSLPGRQAGASGGKAPARQPEGGQSPPAAKKKE